MTTWSPRPGGVRPRAASAARTLRTDRWWLPWLGIGAVLAFFILYTTVRILIGKWVLGGRSPLPHAAVLALFE
jgi:hypothetical protein